MATTCRQACAARAVEVQVWDLPTRIFHAVLIVTAALGWATADAGGPWFLVHKYNGYVLAAALLSRFVWGFAGSRHSRFDDFVRSWSAVRDYAARLLRRDPPQTVGHSPAGGWMVVALLVTLTLLAVTGLFAAGGESRAGPFAGMLTRGFVRGVAGAHETLFAVLVLLAAVHVSAIVMYGRLTGERVIRAMWTGRKTLPEPVARGEHAPVPACWGVAVAVVSGFVVWLALP